MDKLPNNMSDMSDMSDEAFEDFPVFKLRVVSEYFFFIKEILFLFLEQHQEENSELGSGVNQDLLYVFGNLLVKECKLIPQILVTLKAGKRKIKYETGFDLGNESYPCELKIEWFCEYSLKCFTGIEVTYDHDREKISFSSDLIQYEKAFDNVSQVLIFDNFSPNGKNITPPKDCNADKSQETLGKLNGEKMFYDLEIPERYKKIEIHATTCGCPGICKYDMKNIKMNKKIFKFLNKDGKLKFENYSNIDVRMIGRICGMKNYY